MQREWASEELVGSWTLVGDEWRLVGNKSVSTRPGFALLLKFFEIEARFPRYDEEVPPQAVGYVAEQVGVDAKESGVLLVPAPLDQRSSSADSGRVQLS
ncbi:protein of unknown function [Actinopolyspora lacussalsi subsp. righensis]|uniref:DUF4158 domain-containing protein n=1 Tax=Actinopolyspora righensis TaxID=995060 RepID=A0A1I7C343_9ACTN|nr:DUF4158 domain-containing protein [Actinopolyspora righensis]SFT93833.1 protein of unknown function [Actinopolyspora righensis]